MAQGEIAFKIFVGRISCSQLPRTNSKLPSFALLSIVVWTYLLNMSNIYLKIENTSKKNGNEINFKANQNQNANIRKHNDINTAIFATRITAIKLLNCFHFTAQGSELIVAHFIVRISSLLRKGTQLEWPFYKPLILYLPTELH